MTGLKLKNNNDQSLSNIRYLTFKYVCVWMLLMILSTVFVCLASYSLFRSQGIHSALHEMRVSVPPATYSSDLEQTELEYKPYTRAFMHFSEMPEIVGTSLFTKNGSFIVSSKLRQNLDRKEVSQSRKLFNGWEDYYINDAKIYERRFWTGTFKSADHVVPVMLPILYTDEVVNSVAKVAIDFSDHIERAKRYALFVFAIALLMNLISFGVLYRRFKSNVVTIKRKSKEVTAQVGSLSDLLDSNKDVQRTMKTASSRAVELNEQFLRRTGADLHDGPAQLIGYAMLRINEISNKEAVRSLSHEFHAVKEALETSLDEIRGISSGLVLPELETLSLEESLSKVVVLHTTKSECKVKEYYKDLPKDMPLPIKICAYRFVQEGLNNAERHGQAKNCRVTANVTNGVLNISLKDDGMGFRKSILEERSGQLGLIGLKDRVESLGGTFSVNSELGVGTAIKLSIELVNDD